MIADLAAICISSSSTYWFVAGKELEDFAQIIVFVSDFEKD